MWYSLLDYRKTVRIRDALIMKYIFIFYKFIVHITTGFGIEAINFSIRKFICSRFLVLLYRYGKTFSHVSVLAWSNNIYSNMEALLKLCRKIEKSYTTNTIEVPHGLCICLSGLTLVLWTTYRICFICKVISYINAHKMSSLMHKCERHVPIRIR